MLTILDVECRRPSMGQVVEQQEGVLGVSLPPIPGLLVDDGLVDEQNFGSISYSKTHLDEC